MTSFATPGQLASTLGVATPTDLLVLGMWTDALADATAHLRSVIGQPVTAGTATLDLFTDGRGETDIWLVPVTALTSVTCDNVAIATTDWRLVDQRLYLPRAYTTYRVALAYGYATIPDELVRWTKVLAAAQIQAAPAGSLGLSAITAVGVDDGTVSYSAGMSVALPDTVAQRLRATYGGPQ